MRKNQEIIHGDLVDNLTKGEMDWRFCFNFASCLIILTGIYDIFLIILYHQIKDIVLKALCLYLLAEDI